MSSKKIQIYTDGGARGNPGPAGIGVVIWQGNKLLGTYKKYIGKATNNQAEYQGLLLGLQKAKELGIKEVECFLDSELVVNQLNMKFKIKNENLGPIFIKIWNLRQSFKSASFSHIPREKKQRSGQIGESGY